MVFEAFHKYHQSNMIASYAISVRWGEAGQMRSL
jgi:hypothetical protein